MKTLVLILVVLFAFVASIQVDSVMRLSESERDAVLEFYFAYFSITVFCLIVLLTAYFVYDFIKDVRKRWKELEQSQDEAKIEAVKKEKQKERDLQEARMLNKPVFKNTTYRDVNITYRIGNIYRLKIVKPGMTSIFPKDSELVEFKSP